MIKIFLILSKFHFYNKNKKKVIYFLHLLYVDSGTRNFKNGNKSKKKRIITSN